MSCESCEGKCLEMRNHILSYSIVIAKIMTLYKPP